MTERCQPPEGLRATDGWHWLCPHADTDEDAQPAQWFDGAWVNLRQPELWRYIGPVPSPAELAAFHAAAVAEAVAREREALVQLTREISDRWRDEPGDSAEDCQRGTGYRLACDALAAAIRSRTTEPGA